MAGVILTFIARYDSTLDEICQKLPSASSSSRFKRVWNFVKDPEKVVGLRKTFDDAVVLFQVCTLSSRK